MQDISVEICIIGGGPGGYVAAIRAAQLGFSVAVVEKENLGGVCLNWGCMPTKSLLCSSEVYRSCKMSEAFGVRSESVEADIVAMVERSRSVVKKLCNGVKGLMKKNKITVINGAGEFVNKNTVRVRNGSDITEINASNIIIATGARARSIKGFEPDGNLVLDYKSAMIQKEIPKSLAIVGSGAIGMEFGCFYNTIGSQVKIFERMPDILPLEDREISKIAKRSFENDGISFETSCKLISLTKGANEVSIEFEVNGVVKKCTTSKLLMATGISPQTDNLSLYNVGVNLEKDRIKVDSNCRTNISNIYSIGDVNSNGPFLAHKASKEGIYVAEFLAVMAGKLEKDKLRSIKYNSIPSCIYTHPQIASIGMTEQQAIDSGIKITVGRAKSLANGKSLAIENKDGLVKTIFNKKTGELLGAQMIGLEVTEMIQGFAILMAGEMLNEDLANVIFPHPTISEMMVESALSSMDRELH